jgi:predicted HicB family RNase H-like nuclease
MTSAFEYKGYLGSAEINLTDDILHGKLMFIKDIITYAAHSPQALKTAFEEAVDDYLQTCAALGDEPNVPFKGTFNVRVGPERHRRAALVAANLQVSLNDVVVRALDAWVNEGGKQPQPVPINLHLPESRTLVSSASPGQPSWETTRVH